MSPGVLFVWKVSCCYEKVHDFANFGGCTAILIESKSMKRLCCDYIYDVISKPQCSYALLCTSPEC